MIEIRFYRDDVELAVAEAETPEAAIYAAQTLWDDDRAEHPYLGAERARRVAFFVNGVCVDAYGRRPGLPRSRPRGIDSARAIENDENSVS